MDDDELVASGNTPPKLIGLCTNDLTEWADSLGTESDEMADYS